MQIRQLSIFLENKRGELSQICRALAEAGVKVAFVGESSMGYAQE